MNKENNNIMINYRLRLLSFLVCMIYLVSCTPPDARHYRQIDSDVSITQTIHHNLQADPQLQHSPIHIHVIDGMVLLTGQTSHASLKIQAEKAVRSITGVTRLYNEITVGEAPDLLQRKRDRRLTSQVRTQLLKISGMRAVHFKVTTQYDVVYLLGVLTPVQSRLAMDVIRRTPGVKKAVNVLREI